MNKTGTDPDRNAEYRPFVDFYAANKISPVRQDVSNLKQHFERREALYRQLGIAPGLIRGKSVIEFGPGSGHNAIYTSSLQPARYLLVDANPIGLEQTRETLAPWSAVHEIAASYIEEFQSDERFDLVICEGVIPFQKDPEKFVQHVARYAKPGGLVVVTTIDGVSFLGEATRRLLASAIIAFDRPVSEKLERLRPIFAPHLATLKGMSRPIDDWMYDNILIPYGGRLFSMKAAITALDGSCDVYGTAPHFLTDWRWYKAIHGEDRRYNARGIEQYLSNVANLIDYRVEIPPLPERQGNEILENAEALFYTMAEMENSGSQANRPLAVKNLRAIIGAIRASAPLTAESLEEIAAFLEAPDEGRITSAFNRYVSFFGRGQQYMSFLKRDDVRST
ncbi:MAG: class I SAM-dependent methyltransferase [Rhizomicrobium sp.]